MIGFILGFLTFILVLAFVVLALLTWALATIDETPTSRGKGFAAAAVLFYFVIPAWAIWLIATIIRVVIAVAFHV